MSGDPLGGPAGFRRPFRRAVGPSGGMVGSRGPAIGWRLFRRAGRGWDAFPKGQDWLGSPPGGPVVVQSPCQLAGRGRDPSQRAGSSSKALLVGQGGLGDPPERLGGVVWPVQRARSGRGALLVGREGSGGPSGGSGWSVSPTGRPEAILRSGGGWEAFPVGQQWSEGSASWPGHVRRPPDGQGMIVKPFRRGGRVQEALPRGQEGS